jgi:uncharacterized protein (DUF2336 family)
MRALCMGHIEFVEHAMAELAGMAHQRIWLMIHDSGPLGSQGRVRARRTCRRGCFRRFRAALEVYHSDRSRSGVARTASSFRKRMLERTLTLFQSIPKEDLDYLLEKLDATGWRPGRAAAQH